MKSEGNTGERMLERTSTYVYCIEVDVQLIQTAGGDKNTGFRKSCIMPLLGHSTRFGARYRTNVSLIREQDEVHNRKEWIRLPSCRIKLQCYLNYTLQINVEKDHFLGRN